jgi:hypothetical protein
VKKILVLVVLAGSLFAKDQPALIHEWKTGTVEASALQRENLGARAVGMQFPGTGGPAPQMSSATVVGLHRTWQGLMVQGNGMMFTVACQIEHVTRHLLAYKITSTKPNVTVHGPIKYALEGTDFYIQDEDGKEFKMMILQKALVTPPAVPK